MHGKPKKKRGGTKIEPLRYSNYDVVFQEVPNEVALAINITGCPHHCDGCHSDYLWDYWGSLLCADIQGIITRYEGSITCVCFMGGDQNLTDLVSSLKEVKRHGIKTCIYSGLDDASAFSEALEYIDYLKIGRYDKALGGLASSQTNQKFYEVKNGALIDKTYLFAVKRRIEGDD